jgi:hypothetical protein
MGAPVPAGYLSAISLAGLMVVVGILVIGFLLWSLKPGGRAERRSREDEDGADRDQPVTDRRGELP